MQDWEVAIEAAQEKKAEDIVVLNIGAISSFTDHFILCSGNSARQTQAIAGGVEEKLREAGLRPLGVEGRQVGQWILLDYGDFIVHIFTPEKREFFNLERLWNKAPRVAVPEPV
jgi:ribosome-associated protein